LFKKILNNIIWVFIFETHHLTTSLAELYEFWPTLNNKFNLKIKEYVAITCCWRSWRFSSTI